MNRRDLLTQMGAAGITLCAASAGPAQDGPAKHASTKGPLSAAHLHFCGIHMAKKNPKLQFVTQHYCVGAGDGVHQCVLYDGTGPTAKLVGVEYLVTDAIYRTFDDKEKRLWHPHTYEVLAGGLIAPGMPEQQEKEFMTYIMTTWGKAWHTWPDPSTKAPLGEPLLIWSLMGDGQADPHVVAARDREFQCSTDAVRAKRIQQFGMNPPQVGAPNSMDYIGRQWTESGDDKPAKK